MRILILLLLSCLPVLAQINPSNQMATIIFQTTNVFGMPDTNYFRVLPIQNPVLANGAIITKGIAFRMYPDTNGICFTNLQQGWYQMTNAFLGNGGIVFEVPINTNIYFASQLARSGFNTYVMAGVLGLTSSDGSVGLNPVNGVGFVDLSSAGATNGAFTNVVSYYFTNWISIITSNLFSTNVYTTNLFVNTIIGTTNGNFLLRTNDVGTSESFAGTTTFLGTNNQPGQLTSYDWTGTNVALEWDGTNLFGSVSVQFTNANGYVKLNPGGSVTAYNVTAGEIGSDTAPGAGVIRGLFIGDGGSVTNLQPGFVVVGAPSNKDPNARTITAGANITLTDGGAGTTLTIASSGTNTVSTITNNLFVTTNVIVYDSINVQSNITVQNIYATTNFSTNLYSSTAYITNLYVSTNFSTNLYFVSGKGNTLVITNVFIGAPGSLVNSNTANNSAVITDGAHAYTNASNAHGVFTNTASGPPSFGLLQPTEMANTGTAGTYTKTTFNAQGLETSGSSALLASADFANQGTTTTLLHGNASGNPSFGQVVAADIQAGISPTLNAANITNVSGGVITGGTAFLTLDASYLWPGDTIPATWTTNTPGAGSSSVQSAGPTFKAWSVSQTASNRWLAQVNLVNWDGGPINVSMNVVSGTNSLVANAQTNVWAVQAARVGTALGTTVAVTNKLPTGTSLITTNFDCNTITVAGSPNVSDSCLIQIESRAGNTPWSSTNVEYLTAVFIRYSKTNIQNNAISWP